MSLVKKTYNAYDFGLSADLSDSQLEICANLFNRNPGKTDQVLGGRGSIDTADVEGLGPVVVKHYFRGGIIRFFNKQRYLKCGKTRGQREYEMLEKVRDMGVNAPEPLAYAYQGLLVYKAWLVTREIEAHQTLADLSVSDIKQACMAMKNVIEQLSLLIRHRILHVDLHPGNVVIGKSGSVYLVDFDKARVWRGSDHALMRRYLSRWKRAIEKYDLPEMLIERMDLKRN